MATQKTVADDDEDVEEQTNEVKGTRPRNPNRPSVGLEGAIEKTKSLYDKYHRAQVAIPLACANWGYKNPRSSGALQLVAALKAFGLIDVYGQGKSQKVAVSDSAERIIRNAPDRTTLLKSAATSPTLHAEVWEHFEHQLPHDDIIKQYLQWERSAGSRFVDDEAADGFIEQFRGSLRFAGLISADGSETGENKSGSLDNSNNGTGPKTPSKAVRVGSFVQWTSQGVDRFSEPKQVTGIEGDWAFVEDSETGLPMSELAIVDVPSLSNESAKTPPRNPNYRAPSPSGPMIEFPLPGGNSIEIRLKKPVSKKDFERIKQLVDLSEDSLVESNEQEP
jgi:hypothetical protein